MGNEQENASVNTDRELFKETVKDWRDEGYQPKVFVTQEECIGMNVGGKVIVMPIKEWHKLAESNTRKSTPITGKAVDLIADLERVGHHTVGEEIWRIKEYLSQSTPSLQPIKSECHSPYEWFENWLGGNLDSFGPAEFNQCANEFLNEFGTTVAKEKNNVSETN